MTEPKRRRRVKARWRGPKHAELRRAFGEGQPASPGKLDTTLAFADQVLRGAQGYALWLRTARVLPPTIRRIEHLRSELLGIRPERTELRVARRKVVDDLVATADRVNAACEALAAIADRELCDDTCDGIIST